MLPKVVMSFGICKGREREMVERQGVGDILGSIQHQNSILGMKAHQPGTTRDEPWDIRFDRHEKQTIE